MAGARPNQALATALALATAFSGSTAAQDAPLRVAVRVASPIDAPLLERTTGQTSDLNVELLPQPTGPLEPSLAEQLVTARSLADTAGAGIVVWFGAAPQDAGPGAVLVHVADTRSGRVLSRVVAGNADAGTDAVAPDSATTEQAALVVRSTLRALAAGGIIGVEAPVVAVAIVPQPESPAGPAAQPLVPSAPSSPPSPSAPVPARAPEPAVSSLGWAVELGWAAAFDGGASTGQHALEARLGLTMPWLSVSVCGRAGFAAELPDRWATVELSRHAVGLAADVVIDLVDGVDLSFGFELGAAAYRRSAGNAAPGVSLRSARTLWSLTVAPEVRLAWRPLALQGVGFVVSVAADWLPAAPRLGYDDGGVFVIAHELSPFQARIGFGLTFATR